MEQAGIPFKENPSSAEYAKVMLLTYKYSYIIYQYQPTSLKKNVKQKYKNEIK